MATHELITNRNGTVSLRELRSGEVMHSSVGPREEATLLYVEQSRLADRLCPQSALSPNELLLWDIGLGAATNALAALQCRRALMGAARPLHVVSFENDLSGLRLALENRAKFPFFDGLERAVESLLANHEWRSEDGALFWEVHEGDFHDHVAKAQAPELVFFDFYSPKAAPHLWDVRTFSVVRKACEPRLARGQTTMLFTYSASTRVRVAMLMAGFFVGYGRNTGAKTDTTVASTRVSDLERPLDRRWLERLERSHEPLPHGWDPAKRDELFAAVLSHPQFH